MYFINIQFFCCFIHIYLYIYAHWRANLTSCTHLHLKRNFHAIYIHLKGNSTSYIYLGSILVPFLRWVHFFERLLMLPIHNYTYFERHFYTTYPTHTDFLNALFANHSHFARYFHAIYSHTLQRILCHIYSHIYIPLKGIFHAT